MNTNSDIEFIRQNSIFQIISHESYDSDTMDNDMALLKLETPFDFPDDNTIAPICLPNSGDTFLGDSAIVTGWGTTSSGRLTLTFFL